MKTLQLTLPPHSITSGLYALSEWALWFFPALATGFGIINLYLYMFGNIVNTGYIINTVLLPTFLTAIALIVNICIAATHLPKKRVARTS